MAWNEPGGSEQKDPWGNRGRGDKGPPDLDEVLKNFKQKMGGLFGKKGPRDAGGGESGGGASSSVVGLIVLVVLGVWGLSGIYIVESAERGVVLRFGQYVDTVMPGPHWHIPFPIEKVEIVDIDQIRNVEVGYRSSTSRDTGTVPQESLMLTQDENIVDIRFAVQYRVKEAKDYIFAIRDPDSSLRLATEAAIREAIGKAKMDFVLTEGQSEIADRTEKLIQEVMDRYNSGITVTSVNLQSAQPPQEVKGSFDDAIKAREDRQRLINDAEAYSNDILPKARGAAARVLEEANGYKARVVAQAEGESARFKQLLGEYRKNPQVTRQRLYIEAMESVLGNSTKVMVDVAGGNNMMYLPLDKLINANTVTLPQTFGSTATAPASAPQDAPPLRKSVPDRREREDMRGREGR